MEDVITKHKLTPSKKKKKKRPKSKAMWPVSNITHKQVFKK